MKQHSFYQLFIEQLSDIYSAENQIVEALPKMVQAASLPEVKDAFQNHLKETRKQVQRLKKVFSQLSMNPLPKKCKGMEGLIREGAIAVTELSPSALRDAALISAAQRIEHYEISGYGTLRAFAKHLDLDEIADLLQETLDEEGEANKKLTKLAEGGLFKRGINEEAQKEERLGGRQSIQEQQKGFSEEEEWQPIKRAPRRTPSRPSIRATHAGFSSKGTSTTRKKSSSIKSRSSLGSGTAVKSRVSAARKSHSSSLPIGRSASVKSAQGLRSARSKSTIASGRSANAKGLISSGRGRSAPRSASNVNRSSRSASRGGIQARGRR